MIQAEPHQAEAMKSLSMRGNAAAERGSFLCLALQVHREFWSLVLVFSFPGNSPSIGLL
jgi:hypothetical protein